MRINVKWDGVRGRYSVDMPGWNGGELVTVDELDELTAKAEALDALAAWMDKDRGWRRVSDICKGERMEFEVTLRFWRGTEGQQEKCGEADTLAAAIMDALERAK